jgi:beta-glucosidase-like glycosyl hydrolase
MSDFLDQLSNEELATIVSGTSKNVSVYGTSGCSQRLSDRGVPAGQTADGPLGLRLKTNTTAYPSSTLLASSWDLDLAYTYGLAVGEEARELGIDMWLAPGMNIQRDPRCGRNFEYYSEDPLISGRIAANIAMGTQSSGVAVTAKHYAVNNTEHERLKSNSRVSARAIREIYIKGFEIAIKEGDPWCIMSSYNHVNNTKVSETPTLITDIPRDEWGWGGVFMTDWDNGASHVEELRAGHDLKMSTGDVAGVSAALDTGALSREEVKICAARVLTMIMKTNAFKKTLEVDCVDLAIKIINRLDSEE